MMPGDPVVGSTILRRPAVQSPNFLTGVSGWTINADGSAEFNNLTIRGTFNGTDFIINSNGAFFYNGIPAAGNLVLSQAAGNGTDQFGNQYLGGCGTYSGQFATAVTGALVSFFTGSLSGGWTLAGNLAIALLDGHLIVNFGNAEFSSNLTVDGNAMITGTLSVGGSTSTAGPSNNNTSTNGLTNGTINGTSGAASAGTAHTHGAGSYAVNNGQHAHNLSSHLHVL